MIRSQHKAQMRFFKREKNPPPPKKKKKVMHAADVRRK